MKFIIQLVKQSELLTGISNFPLDAMHHPDDTLTIALYHPDDTLHLDDIQQHIAIESVSSE